MSNRGRLLALLVLLTAVAVAAIALRRANEQAELRATIDERIPGLISAGRIVEAAALVEQANRDSSPTEAARRLMNLNFQLRFNLGLGVSQVLRDRLQSEPLVAVQPVVNPLPADEEPLAGEPAVLYHAAPPPGAAYGELFPELAVALGKCSLQRWDPSRPPRGEQTLVVAAEPDLPVPDSGAAPVIFLGPNRAGEARLGLELEAELVVQGCQLVAREGFGSLARLDVSLPFHGRVARYRKAHDGVRPLAELHCGAERYPAVWRTQDQQPPVTLFAIDLPLTLVRLRQGDPTLAGQEVDGLVGLRPSDLFADDLTPPQLSAPFTDLLMETLLQLIEGERPAIRFWHHPAGARSTLVPTSDQDFFPEAMLEPMILMLCRAGARATFFLTSGTAQPDRRTRLTAPTPELVARAQAWGMDFSIHPYLPGSPSAEEATTLVAAHGAAVREHYGLGPLVGTRFHLVTWPGWVEPARWLADAGLRYDLSYITVLSRHIPTLGYMTGSGLPLRYYDAAGQPLPIRQLATQLDDHPNPRLPNAGPAMLHGPPPKQSRAEYFADAHRLLEKSARRFHSPVVLNNHPLQFFYDPDWLMSIVERAHAEDVAILSVADYDVFREGLEHSRYSRAGDAVGFHLLVHHLQQDVLVLNATDHSHVQVDGENRPLRRAQRWGREVGVVTLSRGRHRLHLGADRSQTVSR